MNWLKTAILSIAIGCAFLTNRSYAWDLESKGNSKTLDRTERRQPSSAIKTPLWEVYRNPLPPRAIDLILAHPGMRELSRKSREGELVAFKIGFFRNDGSLVQHATGESIQAQFVQKILAAAFPAADFMEGAAAFNQRANQFSEPSRPIAGRQIIELMIDDTKESEEKSRSSHFSRSLEMSLLKAGNPSSTGLSKEALRARLGIPPNSKVVHFYFNELVPLYPGKDAIRQMEMGFPGVWQKLAETYRPDYTLVSTTVEPTAKSFARFLADESSAEFRANFDRIVRLSEIVHGDETFPAGRLLVINDLKGFVPYLHAISNLAIIRGPINFFEPLNEKTPTLALINEATLKTLGLRYDQAAYEQMAARAKASRGFMRTTQLETLPHDASVLLSLHSNEVILPPYALEVGRKSPFSEVLDTLYEQLKTKITDHSDLMQK